MNDAWVKLDIFQRGLIYRVLFGIGIFAALYMVSVRNYLVFHTLAEFFSIAVAWSVFLLVWNTRRISSNDALLFMGIAYFFVGFIDLMHTLAYKGMGVFADSQAANHGTQLWISARGIEAAALLLFPLLLGRRIRPWPVFWGYAAVTAFVLAAIFAWDLFPDCYIEGVGLTGFKVVAEYVACAMLGLAIGLLFKRRGFLDAAVWQLMIAAMAVTIVGELAFTLYTDVYGLLNMVGHLLKIISFFLVYLALVSTTVTRPLATVFRGTEQEKQILTEEGGHLRLLHQTTSLFLESGTLEDTIGALPELIADYYAVPIVAIELYDAERQEMVFSGAVGIPKAEGGRLRVHVDQTISGSVATSGRAVIDLNVREHTKYRAGALKELGVVTFACVPLISQGGVIGTLAIADSERRPDILDRADLLQVLANALAQEIGRHRQEGFLRESEERYRHLYETMTQGVVFQDAEGKIVEANRAAGDILGLTRDQLFGRTAYDPRWKLIREDGSPYDPSEMPSNLALQTGKSVEDITCGIYVPEKDEYRWIIIGSVPQFRSSETEPDLTMTVFTDITERKQAEDERKQVEEALREKQVQLQAILDYSPALISIKDLEGTVILANRNFEVLDIPPLEEFIGKNVFELFPKEVAEDLWKNDLMAIEAGKPIDAEEMVTHRDGTLHTYLTVKFPLLTAKSNAFGICAISTDITDRKKAEASLKEKELRLRLSMNAAKAGSWIWNIETDEVIWDDRMQEIFGFEPGTFDGTYESWKNAVHPDDIKEADRQTIDALKKGTNYDFQYRLNIESENGYWRTVRAQAVVISNKNGERIRMVGFCVDITEQKKADREKAKLESQLQQAQKMEAIGTLAGGIAHDFNNILAAILGYAEMARDDSPPESIVAKALDKVLEGGKRAKDLVQQILAFSRQSDMERIPLQPVSVVKEALKMLRHSLPTTIEVIQDIPPATGLILADPTQIHQILMNLCTNAFHAMEEIGGKLDISVKEITLNADDLVHEPDVDAGTFVQLSITDSGPGIPPDIKKKVFDPYFTTKGPGKGTGMGLAIVHGIVKSYGGFISLYSEPGEGTAFHVFIPVIEKEQLPEIEDVKPIPVGRERILFIDDEEILADMGKSMLERLGYHVTVRHHSVESLETFQNQPDLFDLVITDQTMPGMTGADIARRMIQIRPDIPIILCTGYSTVISEEKAKSIGIKEFALKPLTKKDLAVLIRKVLDNS